MNLLERIPTPWLIVGAAAACLLLWTAPSSAQTTPDATLGRPLFEDTPNVQGVAATIINSCTNCHTNVQNRRSSIGGSAFADISYATALNHFGTAINSQGAMSQFKALDSDQISHIAAYIADTPKLSATGLSDTKVLAFESSASGVAVSKSITIQHSVATDDTLQVTGVTLAAGTSAFTRGSACNSTTLAVAGSCTFSVTYTPTSTAAESKVLTVSLKQGSVSFTRTVTLNGSVAGATTPPSSGNDDDGGGALGLAWLAGLALATLVLARRRHA